jgi:hypothetical protein
MKRIADVWVSFWLGVTVDRRWCVGSFIDLGCAWIGISAMQGLENLLGFFNKCELIFLMFEPRIKLYHKVALVDFIFYIELYFMIVFSL